MGLGPDDGQDLERLTAVCCFFGMGSGPTPTCAGLVGFFRILFRDVGGTNTLARFEPRGHSVMAKWQGAKEPQRIDQMRLTARDDLTVRLENWRVGANKKICVSQWSFCAR